MVIEGTKVVRRGRNESHVSPNFVQFPVALCLSSVCCLERENLQAGPWIQCKIPALSKNGHQG